MIEESLKALRNDPTVKYLLSWTGGGVDSVLKGSRICNYRIFHLAQYSSFIYLEYNRKSQVKDTSASQLPGYAYLLGEEEGTSSKYHKVVQ